MVRSNPKQCTRNIHHTFVRDRIVDALDARQSRNADRANVAVLRLDVLGLVAHGVSGTWNGLPMRCALPVRRTVEHPLLVLRFFFLRVGVHLAE